MQACREACGGAGFLAANRLVGLRGDLDVYATFEGDNTVLLQMVGKRLLADFGRETAQMDIAGQMRWVAERAGDMALHRTPLRRTSQSIMDVGSRARSAEELQSAGVQRELLEDRVETLVEEIALRLRPTQKAGAAERAAAFDANQVDIVEAARAHGELLQWEAFTAALGQITDPEALRVLTWLRDLFALTTIERNLAWYLLHGRLSTQRAKTVTSYVERLLNRLRPIAADLVDAFGYDNRHLRADIATEAETMRQQEAAAYRRALRASGLEPVSERHRAAQASA